MDGWPGGGIVDGGTGLGAPGVAPSPFIITVSAGVAVKGGGAANLNDTSIAISITAINAITTAAKNIGVRFLVWTWVSTCWICF